MSDNAIVTLLVTFVGSLFLWALYRDKRRIRTRKKRFEDRPSMNFDELYLQYYEKSGLQKESVEFYWKEVSHLLRLDPEKLRPSDRFDRELRPVKGQELGDELEDLEEFLYLESKARKIQYEPSELKTLDDVIRFFAISTASPPSK